MIRRSRRLRHDRTGAAALEMALTFPAILLLIFAVFAVYSLVMCRRAMDVGLTKAMRYAVANSSGGTTGVQNTYNTWAGRIWSDVGLHSVVNVTGTFYSQSRRK